MNGPCHETGRVVVDSGTVDAFPSPPAFALMNYPSFGSCRAVEVIASGPLSEVYLAEQQPLARKVAVKALKSTISPSSPFALALAREGELLSTLHHEHIPRIHEFGQTEDAMWIVMELVDGFNLHEVIQAARKLEPKAAIAIAVGVARALAYLHDRGIVHCDVRPENILVDRNGHVSLVDFGSAQVENLPSSPEPVDGDTSLVTPAYMSPEQILGGPLDARSDVFSLGIVLYEMLTGRRPFADEEDRTAAHRIRHDDAPSLSHDAEVPRGLAHLVSLCLRKLPGDRYGSGGELSEALEELAASLGAQSRRELVASSLARARLVERAAVAEPDAPVSRAVRAHSPSIVPAARMLLVMFALIFVGGGAIRFVSRTTSEDSASIARGPLELVPSRPGYLRVVARPWAHVIIDGQQVETTPFARAIALSAGTHHVTLRHPAAPDERRVIKLSAGERVVLDVTMNVRVAPRADASAPVAAPSSTTP